MRRAAKRDDNEAVIVTALQSAGWTVVRVSDAGAPDLLVARFGVLTLLEVKGPDGKLTPKQEVSFTKLATAGVLVQVVRSPHEALEVVGAPSEFHGKGVRASRWLSENGAFLCESCWLPENGLHAKDCPTRKALKVPPKAQSAHRAAKKTEDLLPKKRETCAMGGCRDTAMPDAHFCGAHDDPNFHPAPRGVEGELQPLPKRGGAKAGTGDARAVITALRRQATEKP